MSLTTDLDALKAQSADLQSQVAQIATEITAKEQAIAAAAGHSALWDRIKAVVAITPVPATPLPFDDNVFGFFVAACEQDEAACALMSESLGNRAPRIWVQRLLQRAGDVLLPDDLFEGLRAVAPVEGERHAPTLARGEDNPDRPS